jgi:hypothetical protein
MRGVIDGLEGEWARVALDDGQRLDWPRENLPAGAAEGAAVVLDLQRELEDQVAGQVQAEGRWQGTICAPATGMPATGAPATGAAATGAPVSGAPDAGAHAQEQGMDVLLGRQILHWPTNAGLEAGDAVAVQMTPDEADTAQRRQRVQSLIDDLFG